MQFLIALAAALAPAMPIKMISQPELVKVRDWWLIGTLCLGAVALAWHGEVWLALMALWYALRWRGPDLLPSLVTWVAIGATWFMLRGLPAWAWTYLPWAWLAVAAFHVGACAKLAWFTPSPYQRRPLFGWWRTKSTHGSPAISGLAFALVAPFCPWWGWPVLLVGVYLTWSWLAMIGIAVGLAVLYPTWALPILSALVALLATWGLSWWAGIRLFEFTPRGDSFDSVINRLIVWWLLLESWWKGPRWLGHGPYSTDPLLRRWSSRCWLELPNGESCNDHLQHLHEYGVLGILSGVSWLVTLAWGMKWGDPWTAALVAALVMALGHYPLRHPVIGLQILTIAAGVIRPG